MNYILSCFFKNLWRVTPLSHSLNIQHISMFPAKNKLLLITVCLKANATSSYRDSKNICNMVKEKHNDVVTVVITDNLNHLQQNNNMDYIFLVSNDTEFKLALSETIKNYSDDRDIIFTLSAHGYSTPDDADDYEPNGRNEFIKVNNHIVLDHDLRNTLFLNMSCDSTCLCLIDTCHSGTMLDLPYYTYDGKQYVQMIKNLDIPTKCYCISACNDDELAGEDISKYSGYGGKLICMFLDYIYPLEKFNIHVLDLYNHIHQTFTNQTHQKSSPVLSKTFN